MRIEKDVQLWRIAASTICTIPHITRKPHSMIFLKVLPTLTPRGLSLTHWPVLGIVSERERFFFKIVGMEKLLVFQSTFLLFGEPE